MMTSSSTTSSAKKANWKWHYRRCYVAAAAKASSIVRCSSRSQLAKCCRADNNVPKVSSRANSFTNIQLFIFVFISHSLALFRIAASNSSSSSSGGGNSCCRSRSSKAFSANSAAAAAAAAATSKQRRCCKCKCRDALRGIRGILESSSSSAQASKDKKEAAAAAAAPRSKPRSSADRRSTPPTLSSSRGSAAVAASQLQRIQRNSVAIAEPSQLAIWAAPPNGIGDVIIRISSQPMPQFVVEPAAASQNNRNTLPMVAAMGHNIRLVSAEGAAPAAGTAALMPLAIEQTCPPTVNAYGAGVTVHSQIDFMHCLVPDLERIINSSFYWGKMDRYEAERLLEGKPEGTFLLRDSAQEEFLFSVTFRKYGRSLHARIEQSGHKFR